MFSIAASQYFTFRQSGCACLTSAAVPVTCGAAIDVPESFSGPTPVPIPAEKTPTPGAVMFGFRKLSPERGPCDENAASRSNPVFGIGAVDASVVVPPSAAATSGASCAVTPRKGIVTT